MKESGDLNPTPTRSDLRYINDHDDPKAVLTAWYNEIPMGAFTSNDAEAFRAAVEDELRHIDMGAFASKDSGDGYRAAVESELRHIDDNVDMSLISIEEV